MILSIILFYLQTCVVVSGMVVMAMVHCIIKGEETERGPGCTIIPVHLTEKNVYVYESRIFQVYCGKAIPQVSIAWCSLVKGKFRFKNPTVGTIIKSSV